jgi:hypothetical protein
VNTNRSPDRGANLRSRAYTSSVPTLPNKQTTIAGAR